MNNNRILLSIFSLTLFITIQSCEDHKLPEPSLIVDCEGFKTVSYDIDIQPIINSKCAIVGDGGCHNGGNGPDLDWRVYSNLHEHRAEVDRRVRLPITATDHMPRIGELSKQQIETLVCWVSQGAPDN
jgi:hypothetical protein